jgi:DNA-binding NarL/FixJ family response regulator
MIAQGESLDKIARKLSLSAKTISTYKARAMQKLGISNHTELVRYALDHRLI